MLPDLLDSMPLSAHGAVALALLAGAVVWIFGRRLFRPMLVVAAAVLGAGVGLVAGAAIPHEWSILWPVGIGAGLGALTSVVAYRPVMGLLLALSLGLAAPLGFFAWAELTGLYADSPASEISDDELLPLQLRDIGREVDEELKRLLERSSERPDASDAAEEDAAPPEWRQRLTDTVEFIAQTAADNWKDAPGRQKWMTLLLAVGGIVVGILMGVLVPGAAASVVTSLAGSLIMLTSADWLLMRSGLSMEGVLRGSAAGALAWWLGAAIIGLLIQSSLGCKKADQEGR